MRLLSVVSVAVALVVAGCAPSPLIGKWRMDRGKEGTTKFEFRADGTFTMIMDGLPVVELSGPIVAAEGKWTLKDNNLTLNVEKSPLSEELDKIDAKNNGYSESVVPPYQPKSGTLRVEFSGDTMNLTDPSKKVSRPLTFVRV